MARARGSAGGGRVWTVLTLVALAAVAAVLVVVALRPESVAESGQLPGPVPTWDSREPTQPLSSAAPTESSAAPTSSAAPVASPTTGFLDTFGENVGIRATPGDCSSSSPRVESTADGGSTWVQLSFGDQDVREVLAAEAVTESQFNLVVRLGSECSVTLLTSFTSGEFWQSYPDRLGEAVYFDRETGRVDSLGVELTPPCDRVFQVVRGLSRTIALCGGGLFQSLDGSTEWSLVADQTLGVVAVDESDRIYAISQGAAECGGDLLLVVDESSTPALLQPVSCASPDSSAELALSKQGSKIWIWSASGTRESLDAGVSWADKD